MVSDLIVHREICSMYSQYLSAWPQSSRVCAAPKIPTADLLLLRSLSPLSLSLSVSLADAAIHLKADLDVKVSLKRIWSIGFQRDKIWTVLV